MQDIKEKVMQMVESGDVIPAGSMVMTRISSLCRDPDATARDLAKVIQLDGSLATRVLRQVNSSYYGLSSKIKTVTHAVVILGFQEVKHLALSIPVAEFYQKQNKNAGIDIDVLWEQTLITACIARALSYHIRHPIPEQVFVSAILAKSGMVVFNSLLESVYAEVIASIKNPEVLPAIEKRDFGLSHVQAGWMLAKQWQFPDELLDSIAYQYNPIPRGVLMRESGLIYAARRLLYAVQNDIPIGGMLKKFPEELNEEFKLDKAAAEMALERATSEFEATKQMLGVNSSSDDDINVEKEK